MFHVMVNICPKYKSNNYYVRYLLDVLQNATRIIKDSFNFMIHMCARFLLKLFTQRASITSGCNSENVLEKFIMSALRVFIEGEEEGEEGALFEFSL